MSRLLLERLASETYNRLYHAECFSVSQSEETITEINLLEIAIGSAPSVLVEKANKKDESESGVDWEWWIRRPGGLVRRYAVQAKRLSPWAGYPKLGFKNKNGYQINLLLSYAAANGCEPLYAFYNFPRASPTVSHWNCCEPFVEEQLGCTLLSAQEILGSGLVFARPGFDEMHSSLRAKPWRCLFCPKPTAAGGIFDPVVSPLIEGRDQKNPDSVNGVDPRKGSTYPEVPAPLLGYLNERHGRKFTAADLPADFYDPSVGIPKRILVSTGNVE